jgi:hypothetical protein
VASPSILWLAAAASVIGLAGESGSVELAVWWMAIVGRALPAVVLPLGWIVFGTRRVRTAARHPR